MSVSTSVSLYFRLGFEKVALLVLCKTSCTSDLQTLMIAQIFIGYMYTLSEQSLSRPRTISSCMHSINVFLIFL